MYKFDAEHPGQSLYTPTTVGVILLRTNPHDSKINTGNHRHHMYNLVHLFEGVVVYRVYLFPCAHTFMTSSAAGLPTSENGMETEGSTMACHFSTFL